MMRMKWHDWLNEFVYDWYIFKYWVFVIIMKGVVVLIIIQKSFYYISVN
jgi:hypothetical protein